MQYPSQIIENAVNELSRFPGIGKKTALRLVLHLIKQEPVIITNLAAAIAALYEKLNFCKQCGNVSDLDLCGICSDENRSDTILCVVEDLRDVMAIESTAQFKGKYHILSGLISPMDGIGPENLRIAELEERLRICKPEEIILALSATIEGDTTAFYLNRKLAAFGLKVSTLSKGIAIGGELEYADEITLGRALLQRIPYGV
jgi:recombination protein RecR